MLIKELIALNEAKSKQVDFTDKSPPSEKALNNILQKAESKLPRACRYKSYETDIPAKKVFWVTQEASDFQNKDGAEQLAGIMTEVGLHGWSVYMVTRDDWNGDYNLKTAPWKKAKSK